MWSPGFDAFIGVSREHEWAVIALNGKTMKGENRRWGGWVAARWILHGECWQGSALWTWCSWSRLVSFCLCGPCGGLESSYWRGAGVSEMMCALFLSMC